LNQIEEERDLEVSVINNLTNGLKQEETRRNDQKIEECKDSKEITERPLNPNLE